MGAKEILERVLAEMNNAEELGGPEGREYVELMYAISKEAAERASRAAEAS